MYMLYVHFFISNMFYNIRYYYITLTFTINNVNVHDYRVVMMYVNGFVHYVSEPGSTCCIRWYVVYV